MVTAFTTWQETSGNGAAIGIVLITTRHWSIKVAWRTIRKDRIRRLIHPSLTRKNACIAAVHFFATISTAHAISLARAAKGKSIPEQITSVFDVSDRPKMSRNKQHRIRFLSVRKR